MANSENVTTKFKVDISDLKSNINAANRQIQLLTAEMRNANAGMERGAETADTLSTKIQKQGQIVEQEERKLAILREQLQRLNQNQQQGEQIVADLTARYNQAVATYGEASEEARQYAAQLSQAQTAQTRNREAIERLNVQIVNQDTAVRNARAQTDQYRNALDQMQAETDDSAESTEDLSENIDDVDESADKASSGGISTFAVALGNLAANVIAELVGKMKDLVTGAIEVGKAFESSMSNVQAISGATDEEMKLLEETARKFGSSTQFSAAQAADALGFMALAGWDAQQSADALGGVLSLAASSGMELAEASDMVTDYMSAFGMQADESAYFADLLSYAQGNANTTAAGLGEAFKNSAANMNAAGQDIETTISLLSMMANQGLKGSEAGTALTAVMRDMTHKMKDGKIAIGETTVEVMDAQGNYRDLTDILYDVEAATNGMGDAEKAAALSSTFTADSIKGLNLILNAGVSSADDFEYKLRGASVTMAGVEAAATDAGVPIDEFKKRLEDAGVSSDWFAESLEYSEGNAENWVDYMNEATKAGVSVKGIMDEMGISLEDLQSAMDNSTGTAEEMARIMNDNLEGDLKSLNSAYEEMGITLYQSVNAPLRDIVQTVTNDVLPAFTELIKGTDGASEQVGAALGTLINQILDQAIALLPQLTEVLVTLIDTVISGLLDAVPDIIDALIKMINIIIKGLSDLLPKIVEKIVDIIPEIVDALADAIPTLLDAAIDFLMAIVKAIPKIIPKIAKALPKIVDSIVKALDKAIPTLINGALQLYNALVQAIPKIIPPIIKALPSIIQSIVSVLIKNIPVLLNGAIQLFMAMVQAIPVIINALIPQIPTIISTIIDILIENIPLLLDASVQLFMAIVDAIPVIAQALWDGLVSMFSTVVDSLLGSFIDNWLAGWEELKTAFEPVIEFFTNIIDTVKENAETAIENVKITFANAWEAIKKVWNAAKKYFQKIWDSIKRTFSTVKTTLSGFFKSAWDAIKLVWDTVVNYYKMIWENIKLVFSVVKNVLSGNFSDAWESIKAIWNNVVSYFQGIWDGIVSVFSSVSTWFKDTFQAAKTNVTNAWNSVTGFFSGIWAGIKTTFSTVGTWFKDRFKEAWTNIKNVFDLDTIKKFFGDLWDGITEKFTSLGEAVGDAVGGAFKTAINWALDSIENVLNFLPDNVNSVLQSITDLTGKELPLFPTVNLPRLAKGGIVDRSMLANVGEDGAEAVIPLEKNKAGLRQIANLLADEMAGGTIGSAAKVGDTIYNFTQNNNSPKALSRYDIYRQTKNLINAVKGV